MLNITHIICGLVAGIVYSVLGWLKNASELKEAKDLPDQEEIVEAIESRELTRENIKKIVVAVFEYIKDVRLTQTNFNIKLFLYTVVQGAAIGLMMAFFDVPVGVAESILIQTGLLTLIRKLFKL